MKAFLAGSTLALALVVPVAAEEAYTVAYQTLYRIDVDSGIAAEVGPTGWDGVFVAAAMDSSHRLFAVGGGFMVPYQLLELDRSSGQSTPVGSLGVEGIQGLALADHALWVHRGDELYPVDPVTGEAGPATLLSRAVDALAAREGRLYAVYRDPSGTHVARVDPATGELEVVTTVDSIPESIDDASFDARGDLRLLTTGGGVLNVVFHRFYRISLSDHSIEETYSEAYFFGAPLAHMDSLALGGPPIVQVPALRFAGLALLSLLLAALGWRQVWGLDSVPG